MKKYLIVLLLFLVFFSACTQQSTQLSEEEKRAQELEYLKEQSQKALEEQEKEREELFVPSKNQDDSSSTEIEENVKEEDSIEEPDTQETEAQNQDENKEEDSPQIDIKLVSVDLSIPRSFELDDDHVKMEVRIETTGIPKGEGFLVEALASNTKGEEVSCQFIYEVGGRVDSCNLDNFKSFGEYTIDVIADLRNRYKEENEKNNVFLDEFTLDED